MKEINILKQILLAKGSSTLPYKLLRGDQETDSMYNATHLEFQGTKCDLEELVYPLKESGDDPKHSLKTLLFLVSREWEGFGGYLTECLTSGISSLGLLEFQPTLLYLQSLKNEVPESEAISEGSEQKKNKTSAGNLDPADQSLTTVFKNEAALSSSDGIYSFIGVQSYHWVVDLVNRSLQKQPPGPETEDELDHKYIQSTQDQLSITSAETDNLPIILLSPNDNALVNINNVVSFLSVGKLSNNPRGTMSNSSPLVANILHPITGQSQQYHIKSISDWEPVNIKEEQRVRLFLTSISDDINELGWKGKYPCVVVYDKIQNRPYFWHTLSTDEEIFKLEIDGDDNIDQLRMMWEFERVKI